MDEKKVMNEIKEQCGDCKAWSGTDCTRNPYTQGCLKDEKKLTDEEIVKALGYCRSNELENTCAYCMGCPAGNGYDDAEDDEECTTYLMRKASDLIHRLQSENDEQKAEIERLKGEKNDWKQRYDSESNRYADLCSASSECVQKKNDRIAEFQKQVDELKEQRDVFKRIFNETNDSSITETQIINAMNSFYKEQAEQLFELKKEQAVKDTAKEIYQEIDKSDILVVETQGYGEIEVVSIERLKEIVKSKGVEVE